MKTYQIVVLPGDGIGPEIVEGALEVLEELQRLTGVFHLEYTLRQAGAACFQETGEPISTETLQVIQKADATFKGPVGLPGVRKPDGTEAGLLGAYCGSGLICMPICDP